MDSIALNDLLVMDIETVSEERDFKSLSPEWQELWSQKIARNLPPDMTPETYYPARAAILAEFAKVVCISFGYFRRENEAWKFRVKSLCTDDEASLLNQFVEDLNSIYSRKKWIFTGHNIKEFDLPFLSRRMIVNNIAIPDSMNFQAMKPWETPLLDTLHLWRFGDYKHYTSLKLLAAVLGIPSPKDDIDGSMVGEVFWKEKDLKRISIYCEKDVFTVANIILRFKGMPLLEKHQMEIAG